MLQFREASMQTQSTIDDIKAMFSTLECDMPPISNPTEAPTYTYLEAFQDKLNANAMTIPSWTTYLGQLFLTIKATDFTTANGTATSVPIDPGSSATAPAAVVQPATRAAIAAAAAGGEAAPIDTILHTDPFTAQEVIRSYQQNQAAFVTFTVTRTALKSMIINNVEDQCINEL